MKKIKSPRKEKKQSFRQTGEVDEGGGGLPEKAGSYEVLKAHIGSGTQKAPKKNEDREDKTGRDTAGYVRRRQGVRGKDVPPACRSHESRSRAPRDRRTENERTDPKRVGN